MIGTPRLKLIACTLEHFEVIVPDDDPALARLLGAQVAPDWNVFPQGRAAIPSAAHFLRHHPEAADWWYYLFLEKPSHTLIGMGGFKGLPDADGVVEIGYALAPSRQGQGFATEAVQGLVSFAFAHPTVRRVQAHTLPQTNASTQVLRKAGFTQHEAPGTLTGHRAFWQWRLNRPAA